MIVGDPGGNVDKVESGVIINRSSDIVNGGEVVVESSVGAERGADGHLGEGHL